MTREILLTLEKRLPSDEQIVWTGVPDRSSFVLSNISGILLPAIVLAVVTTFCTVPWFNINFQMAVLPAIIIFGIWYLWERYNEAKNTIYIITNQRILIRHLSTKSYTVDDIEMIQTKQINHQFGTIYFARKRDYKGEGEKIGFVAIPDVEQVAQHIKVLRDREG